MTTTAPTFIDVLRTKVQAIRDERALAATEMDDILAKPATEGRAELTADEETAFAAT